MGERIHISVNGEAREVLSGTTVRALLEALGLGDTLVAVEVNEEIVTRSRHAEARIADGDAVEIVQFVGGG